MQVAWPLVLGGLGRTRHAARVLVYDLGFSQATASGTPIHPNLLDQVRPIAVLLARAGLGVLLWTRFLGWDPRPNS